MLRGRHRVLPLATDRAVLSPGGETMRRMDEDFNLDVVGPSREESGEGQEDK